MYNLSVSRQIECCLVLLYSLSTASVTVACKYSVRDLAFVDIHDSEWVLMAVQSPDTSKPQSDEWHTTITGALENTNVRCQWLAPTSSDAATVRQLFTDHSQPLLLAVRGPDGVTTPLWPKHLKAQEPSAAVAMQSALSHLIESPSRDEVLNETVTALCVLLIVDGSDTSDARRESIHRTVRTAADQVATRSWALDKATQRGPQVVVVSAEERARERWLLWSIGLDANATDSAVAVIYGAGRCLGETVYGDEIDEERLVRLASVCGRDCECDLDRRWLYGRQMLLRWGERRAILAESHLDFDPQSAMVIAETNAILSRATARRPRASDLPSPGLIIHDLAPLGDSEKHDDADGTGVDANQVTLEKRNPSNDASDEQLADAERNAIATDAQPGPSTAPWLLVGMILAAAVLAATYVLRQREW